MLPLPIAVSATVPIAVSTVPASVPASVSVPLALIVCDSNRCAGSRAQTGFVLATISNRVDATIAISRALSA
jgi:hypothetical protein